MGTLTLMAQREQTVIRHWGIQILISTGESFFDLGEGIIMSSCGEELNCSEIPENCAFRTLPDIISPDVPDEIYISPVGCQGILRRKSERKLCINQRLEEIFTRVAAQMPADEIERKSRVQPRGRYGGASESVPV